MSPGATMLSMLKTSAIAGVAASAAAFAPMGGAGLQRAANRPAACGLRMQEQVKPTGALIKQTYLTPTLFNEIDADQSGTIDLDELKDAVKFTSNASVRDLIQRADLNGDGVIDFGEYERLMNMEMYGDEAGGNVYVRQAIDLGLLKPDSVLADCVMVGNKGFDPLGLATDLDKLDEYREAEIKHGRLAMLAAIGWPAAEKFAKYGLAAGGKAPSLLNGGLENVNPLFFAGVLAFTAFVETQVLQKMKLRENRKPGDLGFDPLGFSKGKDEQTKRTYELQELQHGRLAMIGIVGYVAEEFVTKINVLNETPVLEKAVEKALGA